VKLSRPGVGAYIRRRLRSWHPSLNRKDPERETRLRTGVQEDWGKTQPFWCLFCGRGFASVKRVLDHYAEAGHGNETMSVGSRGLTQKQQKEAFRLMNR